MVLNVPSLVQYSATSDVLDGDSHIILADMLSLKSCIQLYNPTRLDGPHDFHIACPAHIYPYVLDKCISYVIAHMYMAVNVC